MATRDPKQDPRPGDIIRWTRPISDDDLLEDDFGRTYVSLVCEVDDYGSHKVVRWTDINDNGYPDSESARLTEWQSHKGIQSGLVLFVAPEPYYVNTYRTGKDPDDTVYRVPKALFDILAPYADELDNCNPVPPVVRKAADRVYAIGVPQEEPFDGTKVREGHWLGLRSC